MNWKSVAATSLVFLALARTGTATIEVYRTCFTGTTPTTTLLGTFASGADIDITPTACGTTGRASYRITATSSSDIIGRVRFLGNAGNVVKDVLVTAGTETEIDITEDFAATGDDWAGVGSGLVRHAGSSVDRR